MTKIAFIRHGETDSNRERLFAGKKDMELNANGIWQAIETAEKLKSYRFDAAYCGNAKRVRQTYEILSRRIDLGSVYFMDEIREIGFGDWEGLSMEEIETQYPGEWNAYMESWTEFAFPNGEDIREYFDSCGNFIRKLVEGNSGKTIAIIGHKGFILACACYLRALPLEKMFDTDISNGSVFFMNSGE